MSNSALASRERRFFNADTRVCRKLPFSLDTARAIRGPFIISNAWAGTVVTLASNRHNLLGAMRRADLLIGAVLIPGKVDESRLWQVLQHDPEDTQMPPDGKLPNAALADIKAWIEMGAPWPLGDSPSANGAESAAADWRNTCTRPHQIRVDA